YAASSGTVGWRDEFSLGVTRAVSSIALCRRSIAEAEPGASDEPERRSMVELVRSLIRSSGRACCPRTARDDATRLGISKDSLARRRCDWTKDPSASSIALAPMQSSARWWALGPIEQWVVAARSFRSDQ